MSTATVEGNRPSSGVNLAFHVSSSESPKQSSSSSSSLTQQAQQQQQAQALTNNEDDARTHNNNNNDTPSIHHAPKIGSAATAKSKIPDSVDDLVDSALLAALRDPRERLGLLKLEHVLTEFVTSKDPYWDVGGPYNARVVSPTDGLLSNGNGSNTNTSQDSNMRPQTTFQRCLLHRLADRFHITREPITGMDALIRLWKTPDTQSPKRLLLDLQPCEYDCEYSSYADKQPLVAATAAQAAQSNKSSGGKSNRKMKIMKRNSSNVSNASDQSKNTPRKGKKDYSDKEKAYAEARARIFKDELLDTGVPTPTAPPLAAAVAPPPTSNYVYVIPNQNTNTNPSEQQQHMQMQMQLPSIHDQQDDSNNRSKATWRNRRQEVNDPDFQRGGSMVVVPAPYDYQYQTNTTTAPTTTTSAAAAAAANSANPYYAASGGAAAPPQQDYYGGGGAAAYYNNTNNTNTNPMNGRGRGRTGRGGFYPAPNYNTNNYRRSHSGGEGAPANLHSLEEFPSLSLR
jgi:hypothetical protein